MVTQENVLAQSKPHISRSDITWIVLPPASSTLAELRTMLGDESYVEQKVALQELLCAYFNAVAGCNGKAYNISPLGADDGVKKFKARWGLPGSGKSGGLRLALKVDCSGRRVEIAGAWVRRDDPQDADFDRAFRD